MFGGLNCRRATNCPNQALTIPGNQIARWAPRETAQSSASPAAGEGAPPNEDSGVSRNILNRKTFSANNMENGMAVGPRRQVDGEVISLSCRATVRAVYAGAIALMLVSSQAAAADMPERYHGAVERDPTLIGRTSDGESWPVTQRRLHAQKSPRKEPYGSGSQRNAAKARLLATTGVLVAPRVPEKKSRPPAADIEDEQLFREFLEWQKRPKETP